MSKRVQLTKAERAYLTEVVTKGVAPARTILRANILLALDTQSKDRLTRLEVEKAYHTSHTTIDTVLDTYFEHGVEYAIQRKKRETPPIAPKITGDVEARIVALACGNPPEGYAKWTVRLLASKIVELELIDSVSHMTVQRTLKKMNISLT